MLAYSAVHLPDVAGPMQVFGSEETMRRGFLRVLATAPQDYRCRFRA
jgi:hypothetical protein